MIRFLNLNQVQEGTSVTAMVGGNALVIPQRIPAGQEFVEVTLPEYNNLQAIAAPHEDLVFEKGTIYYLDVDVSKEGIAEVVISSSVSWGNSETLPVPGTSTDVNPSPGEPGWGEGDNSSVPGTSTDVNPSPGQPGWGESDNSSVPGTSTDVNPSPDQLGWEDGGKVPLPGTPNSNNDESGSTDN